MHPPMHRGGQRARQLPFTRTRRTCCGSSRRAGGGGDFSSPRQPIEIWMTGISGISGFQYRYPATGILEFMEFRDPWHPQNRDIRRVWDPKISVSSRCIPLHDRNRDPGIPGIQKPRYPRSEISISEISSIEVLYSRDLFHLFCISWISGFRSRDTGNFDIIPLYSPSWPESRSWNPRDSENSIPRFRNLDIRDIESRGFVFQGFILSILYSMDFRIPVPGYPGDSGNPGCSNLDICHLGLVQLTRLSQLTRLMQLNRLAHKVKIKIR